MTTKFPQVLGFQPEDDSRAIDDFFELVVGGLWQVVGESADDFKCRGPALS